MPKDYLLLQERTYNHKIVYDEITYLLTIILALQELCFLTPSPLQEIAQISLLSILFISK